MSETARPARPASRPRKVLRGSATETAERFDECDVEFPSPELLERLQAQRRGERVAPLTESPTEHRSKTDQLLLRAGELFDEAQEREQQSRRALDEAAARAAQIEREAYEKGYQQGEAAGLEMGRRKMEPLFQDFNRLLERIATVHSEVIRANKQQLLDLAVAVATRILHREIETSPDQIMQTLEEVLAHVGDEQRVRLRVSQGDFQHLIDNQDRIPALDRLGDNVSFVVDPEMMRGGCHAATDSGAIDATIERMYEEMRRALCAQRDGVGGAPETTPPEEGEGGAGS